MKGLRSVLLTGRDKDFGYATWADDAPLEAGNAVGVNDIWLWYLHRLSLFRQVFLVARIKEIASVVQWQNSSFPSWWRGFDSRHSL